VTTIDPDNAEEHRNVARVRAAGSALGLDLAVRRFPEGTRTAQDAADAIGCEVGAIVKSLIFTVDGEVVLALVSGANQLDEAKLAAAAGGRTCGRATADQVRRATGFPIGGVPPFGLATRVREFLDEDLLAHATVWAAAGTWHDVFPITPADLAAASGGWVGELRRG
jgi:prolyl-tRNA editing enzyme YbaK/EbsC (Cys-tRNA(Pro) deacylase)